MSNSPDKLKKPYASVLSGIGKGKTEITKLIRDRRNFAPIFEPVESNPYLERFYTENDGVKTWAAWKELRFLADRLIIEAYQLPVLLESTDSEGVIEDSNRRQDNSYTWLHHHDGNIDHDAWDLYKTFNKLGNLLSKKPDLIIHPKAEVVVARQRIKKRGRPSEQDITDEYLTMVDQAILYAIAELVKTGSALLEYGTNHRNLVDNEDDIQDFLSTFDAKLVEIGFPQFKKYQSKD